MPTLSPVPQELGVHGLPGGAWSLDELSSCGSCVVSCRRGSSCVGRVLVPTLSPVLQELGVYGLPGGTWSLDELSSCGSCVSCCVVLLLEVGVGSAIASWLGMKAMAS